MTIIPAAKQNMEKTGRIGKSVLSAVGNTPLIELTRLFPEYEVTIYAKLEQLNPGGSIKDRPASKVIEAGLMNGTIDSNTTVVESSSGNTAVGIAQACAYHQIRCICVVDPNTTKQNIALIKAYGAQIELVDLPDIETGEFLPARLARVRQLLTEISGSYWPNQYANLLNPIAHRETMREICDACDGKLDYLLCATSTCGTLRGCAEYVKQAQLQTKIIAVDAVGSVIFGGNRGRRLVPGFGASIIPELYQEGLSDSCIFVSDSECVKGCHHLLRCEAILGGGSSGAVVAALAMTLPKIAKHSVCVIILPDRGERYLDTIYSREWLCANSSVLGNLDGLTEGLREMTFSPSTDH